MVFLGLRSVSYLKVILDGFKGIVLGEGDVGVLEKMRLFELS